MSDRRRVQAWIIGGAALVLLGLFAASRSAEERPRPTGVEGDGGEWNADARAEIATVGAGERPRHASAPTATTKPRAHEPPRFAGPGPGDPAGPGMLPHPITAEHLRMYRDVDLLDGAWQALKRRDFERARELLKTHATEYAAGYDDMQDGLTILADCMQYPGAGSRERAERFYAERTASSMRRRIRTHCLQTP